MHKQPVTDKASALIDGWPEKAPPPVIAQPAVVVAAPQPVRERHVRYTAAGDRSTLERDYTETRLFKRIGAAVVFGLLILFAVAQHHPG